MTRGDFDYERGGAGYSSHRRADPRIAALIADALGDARSVVNVGAGAGSYEPAGRTVLAVEPSASMRAQRPAGAAPVVDAVAGALPLADDAVDAAMATVTIHQWPDAEQGLRELRRVARDRVVILTFDGSAQDRFWLVDYAPEVIETERRRYPAIDTVCATLGGRCDVLDVEIPIDCTDGFTEAFYARPEMFLDPAVRASQSAWGFVPAAAVDRAVAALGADLESGRWDERYGHLRTQRTFVGSLRLITARPIEMPGAPSR